MTKGCHRAILALLDRLALDCHALLRSGDWVGAHTLADAWIEIVRYFAGIVGRG